MANQYSVPSDRDGGLTPYYIQPGSGNYFRAQFGAASATSDVAGSNNTLALAPGYIPNQLVIDRVGAIITSGGEAGSVLRLGIYTDNGNFYPGDLLVEAGTMDGTSATAQEFTVSLTLPPGWYWFGGVPQLAVTTRPTIRSVSNGPSGLRSTTLASILSSGNGRVYQQAAVSGALPSTFSGAVVTGSNAPIHALRIG